MKMDENTPAWLKRLERLGVLGSDLNEHGEDSSV